VLIRAAFDDDDARLLDAPGMPRLRLVPDFTAPAFNVRVWADEVTALQAHPQADAWISTYLGVAARFAGMGEASERPVDPRYGVPGDEVSFADGFPLLLISQAALDDLNARLDSPVPMLRFRPNLVVADTPPHAEDAWRSIRVGEVLFDVVKPCVRCVLTTVRPETGEFDPGGEPLRSLIAYRRGPKGVTFGQNLIPRSRGTIRLGDRIEILA
jgi:uncharacterized protein YcbX